MSDKDEGRLFVHTQRLHPVNLFAQYDSYEALQDYAARYNGSEAAIASLFIGLTHNVCAKLMADCLVGDIPAGPSCDELRALLLEEDE
tara:strand:- start:194 stop:457 length:264 start_codon:yes stop_codon:yes gene_type:complete